MMTLKENKLYKNLSEYFIAIDDKPKLITYFLYNYFGTLSLLSVNKDQNILDQINKTEIGNITDDDSDILVCLRVMYDAKIITMYKAQSYLNFINDAKTKTIDDFVVHNMFIEFEFQTKHKPYINLLDIISLYNNHDINIAYLARELYKRSKLPLVSDVNVEFFRNYNKGQYTRLYNAFEMGTKTLDMGVPPLFIKNVTDKTKEFRLSINQPRVANDGNKNSNIVKVVSDNTPTEENAINVLSNDNIRTKPATVSNMNKENGELDFTAIDTQPIKEPTPNDGSKPEIPPFNPFNDNGYYREYEYLENILRKHKVLIDRSNENEPMFVYEQAVGDDLYNDLASSKFFIDALQRKRSFIVGFLRLFGTRYALLKNPIPYINLYYRMVKRFKDANNLSCDFIPNSVFKFAEENTFARYKGIEDQGVYQLLTIIYIMRTTDNINVFYDYVLSVTKEERIDYGSYIHGDDDDLILMYDKLKLYGDGINVYNVLDAIVNMPDKDIYEKIQVLYGAKQFLQIYINQEFKYHEKYDLLNTIINKLLVQVKPYYPNRMLNGMLNVFEDKFKSLKINLINNDFYVLLNKGKYDYYTTFTKPFFVGNFNLIMTQSPMIYDLDSETVVLTALQKISQYKDEQSYVNNASKLLLDKAHINKLLANILDFVNKNGNYDKKSLTAIVSKILNDKLDSYDRVVNTGHLMELLFSDKFVFESTTKELLKNNFYKYDYQTLLIERSALFYYNIDVNKKLLKRLKDNCRSAIEGDIINIVGKYQIDNDDRKQIITDILLYIKIAGKFDIDQTYIRTILSKFITNDVSDYSYDKINFDVHYTSMVFDTMSELNMQMPIDDIKHYIKNTTYDMYNDEIFIKLIIKNELVQFALDSHKNYFFDVRYPYVDLLLEDFYNKHGMGILNKDIINKLDKDVFYTIANSIDLLDKPLRYIENEFVLNEYTPNIIEDFLNGKDVDRESIIALKLLMKQYNKENGDIVINAGVSNTYDAYGNIKRNLYNRCVENKYLFEHVLVSNKVVKDQYLAETYYDLAGKHLYMLRNVYYGSTFKSDFVIADRTFVEKAKLFKVGVVAKVDDIENSFVTDLHKQRKIKVKSILDGDEKITKYLQRHCKGNTYKLNVIKRYVVKDTVKNDTDFLVVDSLTMAFIDAFGNTPNLPYSKYCDENIQFISDKGTAYVIEYYENNITDVYLVTLDNY